MDCRKLNDGKLMVYAGRGAMWAQDLLHERKLARQEAARKTKAKLWGGA